MKIYKIWQTVNNCYDTYDSAIVVAENEQDAKRMHPSCEREIYPIYYNFGNDNTWVCNNDVQLEYIGEAKEGMKKGSVIGSFNAG